MCYVMQRKHNLNPGMTTSKLNPIQSLIQYNEYPISELKNFKA
jgi:hypothetical protein